MVRSAKRCIPRRKYRNTRKIGWDDELRSLKRIAQDDYIRWKSHGKQRHGEYYNAMRHSRREFKQKLKKWKNMQRDNFEEKLVDDLTEKNGHCRACRSNGMIDYPVPLECGMA